MLQIQPIARASALAMMALACALAIPSVIYAQEAKPVARQFSAKAGGLVLDAQKLMTADNHSGALSVLAQTLSLADITAYERAIAYQMQGASYYETGQFGPAITSFEKAVSSGGLLPKEQDDMRVKIAQLMMANEQYALGAEQLESYLNAGGALKPEYVEMLTQAWVNANDPARALPWAEKWFAGAAPKERKHFDILNFLYNKLDRPEQQADLVKEMIKRWPEERQLWEAWASLFSVAGNDDDAFAVTKLLYLGGALTTQSELLKVVQYYSFYEMPYQAAQILEKELNAGRVNRSPEHLKQLATLFRQAREYARAIPILEAGIDVESSAQTYAQLGEALYNEGLCQRAEAAFRQAIDRGYEAGKAWTLIATCRYEHVQSAEKLSCDMNEAEKSAAPKTKAREATIEAFKKVPSSSAQNRDAQKWISFVKSERLTFDRQCDVRIRILREECMKEIKRYYDVRIFQLDLELNPKCEAFKGEYDSKYRVKLDSN